VAGLLGDLQDLLNIYQGFLQQILDPKNPVVHDVDPPVPSPLLPTQVSAWDNCGGGVLRDDFNGGTRRTGFSCDDAPVRDGNVEYGSGGNISALSGNERTRIQNVANRLGMPVSVVGSRASGDAGPLSDWDYVITGITGRNSSRVRTSLPSGDVTLGPIRNRIDIFRGEIVDGRPFITFYPE
jgi:hypothetical protein